MWWGFQRRLPVRQTHHIHMQRQQHSINNESRCPCCSVNMNWSWVDVQVLAVDGSHRIKHWHQSETVQFNNSAFCTAAPHYLCPLQSLQFKALDFWRFRRPFFVVWVQFCALGFITAVCYLGQRKSILRPKAVGSLDLPPNPQPNRHTHSICISEDVLLHKISVLLLLKCVC